MDEGLEILRHVDSIDYTDLVAWPGLAGVGEPLVLILSQDVVVSDHTQSITRFHGTWVVEDRLPPSMRLLPERLGVLAKGFLVRLIAKDLGCVPKLSNRHLLE